MNVPSLPLELVIAIARAVSEYSEHDKSALRAMSLACRAWLPVAHQRLFEHLEIHVEKLTTLVQFLRTENDSPLSKYILRIELSMRRRRDEGESIPLSVLSALMSKLPHLQSLTLLGFPFVKVDLQDSLNGCFTMRKISVDFFQEGVESTSQDFAAFINLFSDVEEVYIRGLDWSEFSWRYGLSPLLKIREHFQLEGASFQTRIKNLGIVAQDERTELMVLELVRRGPSVRSLTSISINGESLDTFVALSDLLKEAGESIVELRFGIFENLQVDSDLPTWRACEKKITACTSLRILELFTYVSLSTYDVTDTEGCTWSLIVSLLTTVSPSLRQIHILLQGSHKQFMDVFTAVEQNRKTRFDTVLSRFPHLQQVILTLSFENMGYDALMPMLERNTMRPVTDMIEKALPGIVSKGLLKLNVKTRD
ncbi:hypothetical protein EIP91_003586 [Steccherinum ochraceum]|uniref:F-box domain-containing protein n=1 Tax=Steccherinum ochraceum TaxID=92696 RepID=A0A4R0RLY1_9APHY|nr:hypothetical protein EIP91_003586 [Steccherinum ochraceum]